MWGFLFNSIKNNKENETAATGPQMAENRAPASLKTDRVPMSPRANGVGSPTKSPKSPPFALRMDNVDGIAHLGTHLRVIRGLAGQQADAAASPDYAERRQSIGLPWEDGRARAVAAAAAAAARERSAFPAIFSQEADPRPLETVYDVQHLLGKGQYGRVHLAIDRDDGSSWAVKTVPKAPTASSNTAQSDAAQAVAQRKRAVELRNEVSLMARAAGPGVVQLRAVHETPAAAHMVLQLAEYGSLIELMRAEAPLAEPRAAVLFRAVLRTVARLHDLGIVHRDIKPDNFLLAAVASPPAANRGGPPGAGAEATLVLSDFGLATSYVGHPLSAVTGSPYYIAPEVLKSSYGPPADAWSCGVILYAMLTANFPYAGDSVQEIFRAVLYGRLDGPGAPSAWCTASPAARDLVRRLLNRDPGDRLTAAEALSHRWLRCGAEAHAVAPGITTPLVGDVVITRAHLQRTLKPTDVAAGAVVRAPRARSSEPSLQIPGAGGGGGGHGAAMAPRAYNSHRKASVTGGEGGVGGTGAALGLFASAPAPPPLAAPLARPLPAAPVPMGFIPGRQRASSAACDDVTAGLTDRLDRASAALQGSGGGEGGGGPHTAGVTAVAGGAAPPLAALPRSKSGLNTAAVIGRLPPLAGAGGYVRSDSTLLRFDREGAPPVSPGPGPRPWPVAAPASLQHASSQGSDATGRSLASSLLARRSRPELETLGVAAQFRALSMGAGAPKMPAEMYSNKAPTKPGLKPL